MKSASPEPVPVGFCGFCVNVPLKVNEPRAADEILNQLRTHRYVPPAESACFPFTHET